MTPDELPPRAARYHEKNHHTHPHDDKWACAHCTRDRRICRSKQWRFAEPIEASHAAQRINEDNGYVSPVRPYRCRWCDLWHLTHKPRRRSRQPNAESQRRRWLAAKQERPAA